MRKRPSSDATAARRRSTRTPLTRESVLRAAVELVDDDGLEALSMRRLGAALGVEAMSLYNHVANKEDILDGIIDLVVAEIELPGSVGRGSSKKPAATEWKPALRASSLSEHAVLLRHRWASGLIISRPSSFGPARLRHSDAIVRTMREAGFSMELTHRAFHVLDSYVVGFTVQEVSSSVSKADLPSAASAFLRAFPSTEYPFMAEHITYHVTSGIFDEGDFEFGLDLILEGVERLFGVERSVVGQSTASA